MQNRANHPVFEEQWYQEVGVRLKHARCEQGLSLSEIARRLHFSKETVARLESGRWRNLKADRLVLVCQFLDISLDDVCGLSARAPSRQEVPMLRHDVSFTEQGGTAIHRLLQAWAFLSCDAKSMLLSHAETLAAPAVAAEFADRQQRVWHRTCASENAARPQEEPSDDNV